MLWNRLPEQFLYMIIIAEFVNCIHILSKMYSAYFPFVNHLFLFLWFLQGYAFSEDGEYLAYGTSASGSDWVEIRFLRVEDAVPLEDRLERVKFSCMSWTHDGKGLFYNSYPDQEGKSDGEVKTLQGTALRHSQVLNFAVAATNIL